MRAAGEGEEMCSRASRSSNNRQLQIGSVVLRCSAFRCLPSCAHTHTHTHTKLSPRLISSIKLASQAEREAKRPCTDWHGISPHFSPSASNIFPFFFFSSSDPVFMCCVCMHAGFCFLDFLENVYVFIGLTTYCTFCQGNWLITVKINRQLEK